jgi:hypothetical protein
MPLPLGALAPEPLQPLPAALLEALADRALALGALALDHGSPLPLGRLLLSPPSLEPFGERYPAAPERDDRGVATA